MAVSAVSALCNTRIDWLGFGQYYVASGVTQPYADSDRPLPRDRQSQTAGLGRKGLDVYVVRQGAYRGAAAAEVSPAMSASERSAGGRCSQYCQLGALPQSNIARRRVRSDNNAFQRTDD